MAKNYYQLLGIKPTNVQADIKKAYFVLAKKLHPDVSKVSIDKFQEIKQAYEVLKNPAKKKQYDIENYLNQSPKSKVRIFKEIHPADDDKNEFEINNTRKKRIIKAMIKIIIWIILGGFFGYLLGKSIYDNRLMVALLTVSISLIIGIISAEYFFYINSFITSTKMQKIISRTRLIVFSLSILAFNGLLMRYIIEIWGRDNDILLWVIIYLLIILAGVVANSGDFIINLRKGVYIKVFIIFIKTLAIALGGLVLSVLILTIISSGTMLFTPMLSLGSLCGVALTIMLLVIFPPEIEQINQIIAKNFPTVTVIVVGILGLLLGVILGLSIS